MRIGQKNIHPLLQNDLDPYLATNAHKNSLLEYNQKTLVFPIITTLTNNSVVQICSIKTNLIVLANE
jgi:hypothetical protein